MTLRLSHILFTACLLLAGNANVFAADKPLLLAGKQSLYQRVLAIPGAQLHQTPKSTGTATTPFTAFYVYARTKVGTQEWLNVGTDRFGDKKGWLKSDDTIEWNQGLTVAFRDPAYQDRALLFKDAKSLEDVAQDRSLKNYERLYSEATAGKTRKSSPVAAIQPAEKLDIQDDFYLVPIQKHKDIYVGNQQARMLEVASVPLRDAEPKKTSDYRAGLVFAIDSTLSMDPYINRTREAVRKIYGSLESANLLGNVNFGLVAFRDNPDAAPGLEYLTRTYVDLKEGSDPQAFMTQVESLKAASASSQGFKEDAYAGLKEAIDKMSWEGNAARYLVLVTDAGPRDKTDPLSSTGLSAEQLKHLAREKGIAIFVLHLLTPATKADHANAAKTYKDLSEFPGIGSLYYGVSTGDVNRFGRVLDTLAGQITMQVQMGGAMAPQQNTAQTNDAQLASLQQKVSKLGYALRMRYLQDTTSGKTPRIFNAWVLDRDLRNPEMPSLDVQVLLTRDQLSDLHDILKQVLNTAEEGLLSPSNFLNELKSLAATVTRDASQLGETTATTAGTGNSLADLGFMREYIDDLPYTGEVMGLSLEEWDAWPASDQIDFLHRLEAKINYYRSLHDHTDLWVSLDGGPVDGDSVFPIAIEMLP
jgi:serine/threonine-protein kinase PpkA